MSNEASLRSRNLKPCSTPGRLAPPSRWARPSLLYKTWRPRSRHARGNGPRVHACWSHGIRIRKVELTERVPSVTRFANLGLVYLTGCRDSRKSAFGAERELECGVVSFRFAPILLKKSAATQAQCR